MLLTVLLECKTEKRNSQCERGQAMEKKEEACFARATQVWLAVNHNTGVTSGERIRCSKRIARASELGSCQSKFAAFMRL